MRTLGILLLSLTPVLFGIDYRLNLKHRSDFILSFKRFIIFIREQIRFSGREINEIFALAKQNTEFNSGIFKAIEAAVKKEENLAKTLEKFTNIRLKQKDIDDISLFFAELGKTDTEGQLSHCDYYINLFEQSEKKATDAYRTKGRLSIGLCLCLTMAMFIIMI